MKTSSNSSGSRGRFTGLAVIGLMLAAAAPALAAPIIDGNLQDLIDYGIALENSHTGYRAAITDRSDANGNPVPETVYNDRKFTPCAQVLDGPPPLGTHWPNGVEIFDHYLAYVPGSTTLYLGLRTEGFIGDSDGNGNPDGSGGGACNPNDDIVDPFGIGGPELYTWNFDLNCDGAIDASIRIADNQLHGEGLFAGATGTFAFRANAATGATGHDLELAVQLAAPLPLGFNYVNVMASAFDGLTEDRSDGASFLTTPDSRIAAPDAAICPGGTARVQLEVRNTGQTPLSFEVTDLLPQGIRYAGNPGGTCNVAPPAIAENLVTFPAFDLAAGTNCVIAFDVQAGPDCPSAAAHQVEAISTFSYPCVPGGGSISFDQIVTGAITCRSDCSGDARCRLTGRGSLVGSDGRRTFDTFGGNIGSGASVWDHVRREGRMIRFRWHSDDAHLVACGDPGSSRADFAGTGRYALESGASAEGNMVASVVDRAPGSSQRDQYSIVVRTGTATGSGEVVFQAGGELDAGNLKIDETPGRVFGNGIGLPGSEAGAALLGRAYPNPFEGRTTFAYRVADGGAQVDVGVYDVAGRMVKSLAAGPQPAGIYTVTWDGSDAAGVRMAPGVYFLKSKVGGERIVDRLVDLSR